jgi:glycosyltransferase involved in cell wall biosynthesis
VTKPTLHLVALPRTETTYAFSWCAFTSLCLSFSTMMTRLGYKVILYDGETTDAECAELVTCKLDPANNVAHVPDWSPGAFKFMTDHVIREMRKRIEPGDLILLSQGWSHQAVMEAFPDNKAVEYAVGYPGIAARFRVFPSTAWRHAVYARVNGGAVNCMIGEHLDAVIPHYLEQDKFPAGTGSGGYLAFMARLNQDKGIGIAIELSKRSGLPLKVAGYGTPPEYGEYLGVLEPHERAELMGDAVAVVSPTLYCEPFGLVPVEAMFCGTPALTTDFGAFPETIPDAFRCHTMEEFEQALEQAQRADRDMTRRWARARFSTETIGHHYAAYLQRLASASDIPMPGLAPALPPGVTQA